MRKLIPYVVVFVLGFVVCAWTINHFYGSPQGFDGPERAINLPSFGPKMVGGSSTAVRDASRIISAYVVNIDTEGMPIMQVGDPGAFPFGGMFDAPQQMTPRGKGSGVIFSADGYILTNNHVAAGATKMTVTTHDGKRYKANLIGRDPKSDLAVIKIDAKNLAYAKFADSDKVDVGDWVIAVGNALGRGTTVTIGIISATKRDVVIEGKPLDQVLQTDAAINPGNSGGALADLRGDLVGINSAIASTGQGGGSIGIGFAIPSDAARTIAEQLVKTGKVVRPYLGVRYGPLNDETRQQLLQQGYRSVPKSGALVVEVYRGGPADKAGIRPSDVITKVNGKQLTNSAEPDRGQTTVADMISKSKVGDWIDLDVWHPDGRTGAMKARIGEMPPEFLETPQEQQMPRQPQQGMPMPFGRGFPGMP